MGAHEDFFSRTDREETITASGLQRVTLSVEEMVVYWTLVQ
jgi:hypothetical protein